MNISGVGLIKGDESEGYANPAEDEGCLLELPKHTNSLQLTQEISKPYQVIKVISLEKVKQAREEISEMRKEHNVSVTDCLDVLDKLIAESE